MINNKTPLIYGAGGGKGARQPTLAPNSLFSTDILFTLLALGEGPIYRINPNGPQDTQIQDSSINDLVNLDTDGSADTEKFYQIGTTGTTSQKPLPFFGDQIVSPQAYGSPVSLKKGNIDGIPESKVELQETSANDWDSITFNFVIDSLVRSTEAGDVLPYSVTIRIELFDFLGVTLLTRQDRKIEGKTDTSLKLSISIPIPQGSISENGYRFTVSKISDDVDDSRIFDQIKIIGWDEIKNEKLAYPRTAILGLALKAVNEHQGGVPNFTSLVKGMIVKVPSNYNQPMLATSEIDWRHLEVPETGNQSYTQQGYYLQFSQSELQFEANPQIYSGVWDGTFVYSWTQNPVWIIYDILTNNIYGLGIPEQNIDKYTFYKLAMYCDACDFFTGRFIGVDGLSDGSFRNKPLGLFNSVRENQIGLPRGIPVKERRFVCDVSITEQSKGIDVLNELCAAIRSILIYSGGKISIATDMPDEYPAMIFNEKNIKKGSISVSGYKLSDVLTAVDVSYIDPTNHFKREMIRVDANEVNAGVQLAEVDNTLSIDLKGVTRRSQAMRSAQYLLASSRYQKRSITFTTGTEALYLSAGDLISVSTTTTGINYGYGGRIRSNSAIADSGNTFVFLEHYTSPAISNAVITSNSFPLALRVTKADSDRTDLYIVSNSEFAVSNVFTPVNDSIDLKVLQRFDPINKTFGSTITQFDANTAPVVGDLWSFGEIENPLNFYTSKAGRLFKIKEINRSEDEEITISAVEYIPEVYTDSDSFINYEPTPYIDVINYLETPPTPKLDVQTRPRRRSDGSIAIDARITTTTPTERFYTEFATEYEIANPQKTSLVSNAAVDNTVTVFFNDTTGISNNQLAILEGKNGFSTQIGVIPILCNAISTANLGFITLTVQGLSSLIDENFNVHVLEVNDGIFPTIPKGLDAVVIPIRENTAESGQLNFVGYADNKRLIARAITGYDIANNTITIADTISGLNKLSDVIASPPFYVNLNQVLEANNYANNSFFVEGHRGTYVKQGNLNNLPISLDISPRRSAFVRFYVDGILKNPNQYVLNRNDGLTDSNIVYTIGAQDVTYRVEVDYYLPPIIEVGDLVEDDYGNAFTIASTSYDSLSPSYNAALTTNSIFRVRTLETPIQQLSGQRFINVSLNPEGILTNVQANTAIFNYSTTEFPGSIALANYRLYSMSINSDFESVVPDTDSLIKDLPLGRTVIRARNRNLLGRVSRFSQKAITAETLPIRRVTNFELLESLYREQTGGVAVRVTASFDHITEQDVTDYEISYKVDNIFDELGKDTSGLTAFNTVKVPASGVDTDGKIRFTINNIDRGSIADTNFITVKVTPLNKEIRGKTVTLSQAIDGKTTPPDNIFNLTGGQQNEQFTLFWAYPRIGDQLKDIDLKEVVFRRLLGTQEVTLENFAIAEPYVTVSAGSSRKTIPIDFYGTYTYLARTRDTSDRLSADVVGVTITTTKPQRSATVFSYSEDDPALKFSDIENDNALEVNFPSFNDSNTGGIAFDFTSATDNANGSSTGWSAVAGSNTDLLASASATYITQIRDIGTVVTATIALDIEANQALSTTFNDQYTTFLTSVSEPSATANVLIDTSFGGIGQVLGFGNASITTGRYDSNNRTWMTGTAAGNVWAIWNLGQFNGDTANANSFALIAGLINTNAIALGNTFFANGTATGTNAFANVTTVSSNYRLVNLRQFIDVGTLTFQGDIGAVTTQTFIRTSTAENVFYANGNVNISTFDNFQTNDGWVTYEAGARRFRHFQIRYEVLNNDPEAYDLFLDKLRYTIDKEQTITSNTIVYSSSPTTVDFTASNFLTRPVISYAVLDQIDAETNTAIAITTSASNQNVSFKLFASDGSGEYNANSSANVMVTIVGV